MQGMRKRYAIFVEHCQARIGRAMWSRAKGAARAYKATRSREGGNQYTRAYKAARAYKATRAMLSKQARSPIHASPYTHSHIHATATPPALARIMTAMGRGSARHHCIVALVRFIRPDTTARAPPPSYERRKGAPATRAEKRPIRPTLFGATHRPSKTRKGRPRAC